MSTPLPYTPALRAGDWVIVSGQLGMVDGVLVTGGFEDEVRQALVNLEARLTDAGATLADVVKATVFLRHMSTDFPRLNEIYAATFAAPFPARSAVGVAELPLGGLVEIEAWAFTGTR